MLCCCDALEPLGPEEEYADTAAEIKDNGDSPDNKRRESERSLDTTVDTAPREATSEQLVSVTVPGGVRSGQTLKVRSPDGLQTVTAIVPEGLTVGDSFLVRFPSTPAGVVPVEVLSTEQERTDPPQSFNEKGVISSPVSLVSENHGGYDDGSEEEGAQESRQEEEEEVKHSPSLVDVIEDFITPTPDVPEPAPQVAKTPEVEEKVEIPEPIAPPPMSQKLLSVQVPPGVRPGTTIHVEIPGEFRTLAAQVPPNVKMFHVAYTPQPIEVLSPEPPQQIQLLAPQYNLQQYEAPQTPTQTQQHSRSLDMQEQAPSPRRMPQAPASPPPPQQAPSTVVRHHTSAPGQKLLLVRVPEGTLPGTTLHVSVPDEPGRILAAQVPPGGVRQFHVSYESRAPSSPSRSMLPPANPYAQGNASPYHHQQTGAPVGVSGMAANEHYARNQSRSNQE